MNWSEFFDTYFATPEGKSLNHFLRDRESQAIVLPKPELRYRAFELCPPQQVKVVMIGQDPYHQHHQANGLAFSVNPGIPLPPSLKNIYKEIQTDVQVSMDFHDGDLTYLAEQGVLLLNTILTVELNQPLAHRQAGYDHLFQAIMNYLTALPQAMVFLLWGKQAHRYQQWIHSPHHLVLTAHHPSPLAANRGGWFGCHHFSLTNDWLIRHERKPVQWSNIQR